jgi:hypothetical protein
MASESAHVCMDDDVVRCAAQVATEKPCDTEPSVTVTLEPGVAYELSGSYTVRNKVRFATLHDMTRHGTTRHSCRPAPPFTCACLAWLQLTLATRGGGGPPATVRIMPALPGATGQSLPVFTVNFTVSKLSRYAGRDGMRWGDDNDTAGLGCAGPAGAARSEFQRNPGGPEHRPGPGACLPAVPPVPARPEALRPCLRDCMHARPTGAVGGPGQGGGQGTGVLPQGPQHPDHRLHLLRLPGKLAPAGPPHHTLAVTSTIRALRVTDHHIPLKGFPHSTWRPDRRHLGWLTPA